MPRIDAARAAMFRMASRGAEQILAAGCESGLLLLVARFKGFSSCVVIDGDTMLPSGAIRCSLLNCLPGGVEFMAMTPLGVSVTGCTGGSRELPAYLESALRSYRSDLGEGIHPIDRAAMATMGGDVLVSGRVVAGKASLLLMPHVGGMERDIETMRIGGGFLKACGDGEGLIAPHGARMVMGDRGVLLCVSDAPSAADMAALRGAEESLRRHHEPMAIVESRDMLGALKVVSQHARTVRVESRAGWVYVSAPGVGAVSFPAARAGTDGVAIVDAAQCGKALRGWPKGTLSLLMTGKALVVSGNGTWSVSFDLLEREIAAELPAKAEPKRKCSDRRTLSLPLC